MIILYRQILWLLLLLIPIAIGYLFIFKSSWRAYLSIGGNPHHKKLFTLRFMLLALSFTVFYSSAVLALADIYIGRRAVQRENLGLDVVFVLDISNSMLATDIPPSRLEAMRFTAGELAANLSSSRLALVIFKGTAVPVMPLTDDNNAVITLINHASPSHLTSPGSDLAAGINSATSLFANDNSRKKVIIVLSDGEALSGDIEEAIRLARRRDVTIFAIGVGTHEGSHLFLPSGEQIMHRSGQPVISRLEEAALITLANHTNGWYHNINEAALIETLLEALKGYEQSNFILSYVNYSLFNNFVLLAIISLIGKLAIRSARWSRLYGSF
ncbi:MAG: VWA domain-containing protein [Spirochaetaceae bacterium]|nr:VWA domain-containing protein [Spirochaetaceae bacterium]